MARHRRSAPADVARVSLTTAAGPPVLVGQVLRRPANSCLVDVPRLLVVMGVATKAHRQQAQPAAAGHNLATEASAVAEEEVHPHLAQGSAETVSKNRHDIKPSERLATCPDNRRTSTNITARQIRGVVPKVPKTNVCVDLGDESGR